MEVRQRNARQARQAKQAENKNKEEKKIVEKKKQEEPFWRKMLKGKTGSKEGNVRASG